MAIRGHGLRSRVVLGPAEPAAPPCQREVRVRRYRCSACGCVMIVVPAEMTGHLRYSLWAILWALALWSLDRLSAGEVRRRVSVNGLAGFGEPRLWQSLRRWARQHQRMWPTLIGKTRATSRQTAEAVVTTLIARDASAPAVGSAACAWRAAQLS